MIAKNKLASMTIADILQAWPEVVALFNRRRMACPGCVMSPFMTLADAAAEYGVPLHEMQEAIVRTLSHRQGVTAS